MNTANGIHQLSANIGGVGSAAGPIGSFVSVSGSSCADVMACPERR